VLDWCLGKPDVTSAEVLVGALKVKEADISRVEQNRIGTILKLAGWKRQTVRRMSRPLKAWVSPE